MQLFLGFMDLIEIFAQILHGIRVRSIVACSVFGEKKEEGFGILDLVFFQIFSEKTMGGY